MNEASEIVFCIPSLNHHFWGFLSSQDMILWLTLLEEIVRGIIRAKIVQKKVDWCHAYLIVALLLGV